MIEKYPSKILRCFLDGKSSLTKRLYKSGEGAFTPSSIYFKVVFGTSTFSANFL